VTAKHAKYAKKEPEKDPEFNNSLTNNSLTSTTLLGQDMGLGWIWQRLHGVDGFDGIRGFPKSVNMQYITASMQQMGHTIYTYRTIGLVMHEKV
jgi:hypothetical protein